MQILLRIVAVAAFGPIAALASDVESRSEARFERKVEKNSVLAKNLAARMTTTVDRRKARDTRLVSYKGNRVSAYVRREEKHKVRFAERAAKMTKQQRQEEAAKQQRQTSDDNSWSDV